MFKPVLFSIVALFGVAANAYEPVAEYPYVQCETFFKFFKPTVRITTDSDGIYIVNVYGHSRNTYLAKYKATFSGPTRIGSHATLELVQDLSTWKDMPQKLTLNEYLYGGNAGGYSIWGLGSQPVFFSAKECKNGLPEFFAVE